MHEEIERLPNRARSWQRASHSYVDAEMGAWSERERERESEREREREIERERVRE